MQVPHEVLNAQAERAGRESEIVAQAGRAFAITIATNMAGRGTDILLGGTPATCVLVPLYTTVYASFTVYYCTCGRQRH